jgi:hypothetical protein
MNLESMLRQQVILAIQSHPFMVTSWSEEKQQSLDLFIEPHGVLASELLLPSKSDHNGISSSVAQGRGGGSGDG